MGIAEVVPGISGGTIAFISGIYGVFMSTLAGLSKSGVQDLFKLRFADFWNKHNGTFLVTLGVGMVVGAFSFAQVFSLFLSSYPEPVQGFFLGVVAASVIVIGRVALGTARRSSAGTLLGFGFLGVMFGLAIGLAPAASDRGAVLLLALGGFLAIGAWMLPGISGALVLVVLGVYGPTLDAVRTFDLVALLPLFGGMAAGAILVPRMLVYALEHWRSRVLIFLTGLMAGSLPALWPWRVEEALALPTALSPMAIATGLTILLGVVLVAFMPHAESRK